jgi:sulfatase maturation enzyme AslB (radical SAM superfamily)
MPPSLTILDSPPPGLARALAVNPYLHLGADHVYQPLRDELLRPGHPDYDTVRGLLEKTRQLDDVATVTRERLLANGWLVAAGEDLSDRFYLKYVSLEAHTVCNQGCYFCPVSTHRREDFFMAMETYEAIVAQLAEHRDTIEGVSMINYNEPTVDKRFVEQVALLQRYGLPPAVLTNGTGLTAKRVDAILETGGLVYLSINLSTLDRERYAVDREGDHLAIVLKNLEYMKDKPLAKTMEIVVLGQDDAVHEADFRAILERFGDSRFDVKKYPVMDRAGLVQVGMKPAARVQNLCGCEQTGSRPLQWAHITPRAEMVLCCQDYHSQYVVGNLHEQTLDEILRGPEMARYRRWTYGVEEAPQGFMCRNCIYALSR